MKKIIRASGLLLALGLLFISRHALAATLYLSPASGKEYVGQSFTVDIDVSSADRAMNAAQGTVSFPIDQLSVVSLSKAGSLMNFWVQEPSFSNKDGVINFEGIAVNPGFTGSGGRILTVTFTPKTSGTANLLFSSSAVLANDGKGTNILNGATGADFTIMPAAAVPPAPAGQGSFAAPTITSSPPTDNAGWYNFNAISYGWTSPTNFSGASYALATSTNITLPAISMGTVPATSIDLSSIPDGIWYFLVSVKAGNQWSVKANKTLRLDRTPPDQFTITRTDTDLTEDQPSFAWSTSDRGSGMAYYEVKIGDGDWFQPSGIRSGSSYILPIQSPAESRQLTVRAYDNAGNFQESSIKFRVIAPNSWTAVFYHLGQLLSLWWWIFPILAAALIFGTYYFIYNFVQWRRRLRDELGGLAIELRHDLSRVQAELEDLQKEGTTTEHEEHLEKKKKEILTKGSKELEGHISDEIKKIEKL